MIYLKVLAVVMKRRLILSMHQKLLQKQDKVPRVQKNLKQVLLNNNISSYKTSWNSQINHRTQETQI